MTPLQAALNAVFPDNKDWKPAPDVSLKKPNIAVPVDRDEEVQLFDLYPYYWHCGRYVNRVSIALTGTYRGVVFHTVDNKTFLAAKILRCSVKDFFTLLGYELCDAQA